MTLAVGRTLNRRPYMMSAHVLSLHKKAVSHVSNNHVLIGTNPCFNQAIYMLLMHGFFVVAIFFFQVFFT